MTCEAVHPERPLGCGLEGNHALHAAFVDDDWVSWPNSDFVPARPRHTRQGWVERMNDIASRADRPLPTRAVARTSDPITSWQAAASVLELPERQAAVWFILETYGPFIDEEMVVAYQERVVELDLPLQTESGLRTRRSELVRAGFVEDTGGVRPTQAQRPSIIWAARVLSNLG